MYIDKETQASLHYLKEVVQHLDDPICLLGGWAVYYLVNDKYNEAQGSNYLGSRDVDLGFNNIKSMNKAIFKLEKMGFERLSFRMFKELHTETMKELTKEESKTTPTHYIFPMYVDLIIAKSDKTTRSNLGFAPIDEPLLKHIFEGHNQKDIKLFSTKVILPSSALLLNMKLNSIKDRDKEHKRLKDLCDIVTLCLYSGIDLDILIEKLDKLILVKERKKSLNVINEEDIKRVSQSIKVSEENINALLKKLTYM